MPSDDEIVNILSLDGGGVRALSEVMMLDRIMKRIQEKNGLTEIPKPCDYFHLIGGIGTGGIAAILFGRLRMTTTEALTGYENIASEIFSTRKRRLEFSIDFREEKVEKGMKKVMKDRKDGNLMRDEKGERSTGKSFVVARRSDGSLRRIRAYRHGQNQQNLTIYEAARATAASIESSGDRYFADDTKDYKNPIREVLEEATEVLENTAKVGCVLSLGAGTKDIHNRYEPTKDGKKRHTEKTDNDMRRRFANVPDTYFRLNVYDMADKVEANKSHEIPAVKSETERWLGTSAIRGVIDRIVDVLTNGTTSGVTVDKLTLDEINPKLKQGETAESPTTHPVSQANTNPKQPTHNNNDMDPDDPTYRSEQADLWAQYSEYASTLGPSSPESLTLLDRIFEHMLTHKHLSCSLRVAEEAYKRCLARNGPSALTTSSHFGSVIKAQILLGEVFRAYDLQEELVSLFTKTLGPEHAITQQAMETLEKLRENKRKREWGMESAMSIMMKHEDWVRGRPEAVLRVEIGDEGYEQRGRDYVNAVVVYAAVQVGDVCKARGGCKERGFGEVDGRLGISASKDAEMEMGLVDDFS
ncbi:acyl transferase/acyl hydrolase/lysophospholipase [Neurospora tetraspora]|uniref:Acyl transferase/acyl hydrolase/lysophospholipase n=1 Tax=Neurospora tetraspora TaxID=94610 RepID=A0AAE0JSH7_9PEZI|nr:acyl transferase/acyl hydrolase/lysophospholipase [Neurospora tetraspora]